MVTTVIYSIFTSFVLISTGLYHLIFATRTHLRSPRDYFAKPYHPLPIPSSSPHHQRLRHLQIYLLIIFLLIAFTRQTLISTYSDPLLKGRTPVHHFTSLQSAAVIFLFLILSVVLLLTETTSILSIPTDLFFGLASVTFFLQYFVSSAAVSFQTSDLQAKCDSVSAVISALSAIFCLVLAFHPKLFIADVGLGGSIYLQGLWVLQTGLSLFVDAFIPEGCHKLLDVVGGVEGSTKCELDDSKLRAIAILDLLFVIHVGFVVVTFVIIYAAFAKSVGNRRIGAYEALPTLPVVEANHVQMKALSGTQA
ncbi:uncharacterized protein LOC124914247 [Impatiens glandulifera]|uniref:uncharacterized protein LOC124914247 n=1 Tax=Impatiens glandulifera TaxID=253017 RepID=UPI001FB18677|nr:uncharacterized protein LOC124914247 [Impatiens glandulifera]